MARCRQCEGGHCASPRPESKLDWLLSHCPHTKLSLPGGTCLNSSYAGMHPRSVKLISCRTEPITELVSNPQAAVCAWQVHVRRTRFEDRGAALMWTVQRLPALLDLEILDYDETEGSRRLRSEDNGMPWCSELAELRSRSLTRLAVHMLGGLAEGNTLRLVGLPELRALELRGEPGVPSNMCIERSSFAGAPQLHSLAVHTDEALQLEPGSLSQLTALTSLKLTRCGLRSVPADVTLLIANLCELDLSSNGIAFDASFVASVLECGRLRTLAFRSTSYYGMDVQLARQGFVPIQMSLESLQRLMQLPLTFYRRHGRELHVCVTEDDYWSTCCCQWKKLS